MSTLQACPRCLGRGSVIDADPYADRRQVITCPDCGGRKTCAPAKPAAPIKVTVTAPQPETKFSPKALPAGVTVKGWDSTFGRAIAAIVTKPLSRPDLDSVYKRLVPAARQQIRLARKWGVWGVLAPDDWASEHGLRKEAP